jgi:hypothetical protein
VSFSDLPPAIHKVEKICFGAGRFGKLMASRRPSGSWTTRNQGKLPRLDRVLGSGRHAPTMMLAGIIVTAERAEIQKIDDRLRR